MARYQGTIVKLVNQHCGFIGRDTLICMGKPVTLPTAMDIYIHADDYSQGRNFCKFERDIEVSFEIVDDPKRNGGFRATNVRPSSTENIIHGGIELHFDEKAIDHPVALVRWCLSDEILKTIESNLHSTFAMVFVASPHRSSDLEYGSEAFTDCAQMNQGFSSIVGIRDISSCRAYVTFPSPGTYDLVAYLMKSTRPHERLVRELKKRRMTEYKYGVWDGDVLETNQYELSFVSDTRSTLLALTSVSVEVPKEVFAKPFPKWALNWLGYFNLDKPRDECSMRGRILAAFTLGVALYLIWEGFKRTLGLVIGVVYLLLGGNPFVPWRKTFARNLSVYIPPPVVSFEPFMRYDGWRVIFRPIVPLILIAVVWLIFQIPRQSIIETLMGIVISVAVVGTALVIGKMIAIIVRKIWPSRSGATEVDIDRLRTYAVCGNPESLKDGPITVKLLWTGIKRRVCGIYA